MLHQRFPHLELGTDTVSERRALDWPNVGLRHQVRLAHVCQCSVVLQLFLRSFCCKIALPRFVLPRRTTSELVCLRPLRVSRPCIDAHFPTFYSLEAAVVQCIADRFAQPAQVRLLRCVRFDLSVEESPQRCCAARIHWIHKLSFLRNRHAQMRQFLSRIAPGWPTPERRPRPLWLRRRDGVGLPRRGVFDHGLRPPRDDLPPRLLRPLLPLPRPDSDGTHFGLSPTRSSALGLASVLDWSRSRFWLAPGFQPPPCFFCGLPFDFLNGCFSIFSSSAFAFRAEYVRCISSAGIASNV